MNTANNAQKTIISDVDAERLLSTLATAHGVVKNYKGAELAAFDDNSPEMWEEVLKRTFNALTVRRNAMRQAKLASTKNAIDKLATVKREAFGKATAALASMTEEARSLLGVSIPTEIKVPMSEILGCFPAGTKEEQAVVALKEMSYTVSKAKSGPYSVLFPATLPVTPPATIKREENAEETAGQ